MTTQPKKPSLLLAFIPLIILVAFLFINVIVFSDDATYGPNQIALIIGAIVAGIVVAQLGYKWKQIVDSIVNSISSAMSAVLILLIIGSLAGTWLISGVVPAMIYYGLQILNPTIFLFAACLISAIVSLATGSSWSTVATVGVALLSIGNVLGFSEGLIAGAVISGAYFGDKMSPLSDTTNLAPAMAGTDLFTHIRYMALTTIPSISVALVFFLIWGFTVPSGGDSSDTISAVLTAIESKFTISPWLFLVPVIVIGLIIKKVPALPALVIGTFAGAVFALIFQQELLQGFITEHNKGIENTQKHIGGLVGNYKFIMQAIYGEISVVTENKIVDKLLSTGGMYGMLNTVWLILCAMIFGGVMEAGGLLRRITESIIGLANTTFKLFVSTVGTCLFFNATASDQYLAIVVPGRMYRDIYRKRGLAPQNLSRTLEDSGTVTSVLVPWNTCGAYMSGTLGVATLAYLPFCIFNIISPLMTLVFAFFNIKIAQLVKGQGADKETEAVPAG